MIILGAADLGFTGRGTQAQSVNYISGVTNLLLGAKNMGIPRVVYCSTYAIANESKEEFSGDDGGEPEVNYRMSALDQAEKIVSQYQDDADTAVEILRYPELYGEIGAQTLYEDMCNHMLVAHEKKQPIEYKEPKIHELMYVDDAVQILMCVTSCNVPKSTYYVKGTPYSEQKIAQEIARLEEDKVRELRAIKNLGAERSYQLPDVETDEDYLKFKELYNLQTGIQDLYKLFQKENKKQSKSKTSTGFKKAVSGFVETIVLFIIVFCLELFFPDFIALQSIDFYLVYTAIIAVSLGVNYAMLATALSIAAKFYFLVVNISDSTVVFNYDFFLQVLQVVIIGVIVGLMRDSYNRKNADLQDANKFYQKEIADVISISDGNLYVKNIYEKRLVNYKNSLGRMYEITNELDFLEPKKVIFKSVSVVAKIMETKYAAIYVTSQKSQFFRLAARTKAVAAMEVPKSFFLDDQMYFFERMANHEIYINRTLNEGEATFVGAIYGVEKIEAIVMVWMDELEKVNLYQSNLMAIICRLSERSMTNALSYDAIAYEGFYVKQSRVLKIEAFIEKVKTNNQGRKMEVLDYTLLRISMPYGVKPKSVLNQLEGLVRDTDDIGIDKQYAYVLLTNSTERDAGFVVARVENNGFHAEIIDSEVLVGEEG